jgi:hypothetical protein
MVQPRMLFVHGNYVNVHVKNDLPSGFAVVLDNSYSFRTYCLIYGVSQLLYDFVQVRYLFLWNLVDVRPRRLCLQTLPSALFCRMHKTPTWQFQFYYSNTVGVL